jgi:hypothetical protein
MKDVKISGSGVRNVTLNGCEWRDLIILIRSLNFCELSEKLSYGCVSIEPVENGSENS